MIRAKMSLVAVLVGVALMAPIALADDAAVQQGIDQAKKGDYDGAITTLKRAVIDEQSQGSTYAGEVLFKIYYKLNRFDDGIQLLQDMISRSKDPIYVQWLGDTYMAKGDFYSAQHTYEDIYNTDPTNDRAKYQAAMCLDATGNYDAARDMLKKVVEQGGDYAAKASAQLERAKSESQVTAIDVDTEVGRWAKASMPLKVYVSEGTGVAGFTPQLRNYVLRAVAEWQNVSHGLIKMELVTDKNTADIAVGFAPSLGNALGVTRAEPDSSGTLHKALIAIACNVDSLGRTLPAETPATRNLYESRDRQVRDVALHEFGHALGLDHSPRSDDIMANGIFGFHSTDVTSERNLTVGDIERITQLYTAPEAKQGQDQKAALIAALQKALAKVQADGGSGGGDPSVAPATMRGGNPYLQSAASGGEHAAPVKIDPHTTAMQQAIFALQGGKPGDCIEILKDVIAANPKNAQAHYIMAVACVNMRNYLQAQKEYEAVLKLVPTGKLADLANAGLSKIKK